MRELSLCGDCGPDPDTETFLETNMAEIVREFMVKANKSTSEMSYETSQEAAEIVAKRKSTRDGKLYKVYMLVSAYGPTQPPLDWLKISERNDMTDMNEAEDVGRGILRPLKSKPSFKPFTSGTVGELPDPNDEMGQETPEPFPQD